MDKVGNFLVWSLRSRSFGKSLLNLDALIVTELRISLHQTVELIDVGLLDGADAIDGEVAIGAKVIVVLVNVRTAVAAILHRYLTADGCIEGLCLTTGEAKARATKEGHALTIAAAGYERVNADLAHDERLIAILRVLSRNLLHVSHER